MREEEEARGVEGRLEAYFAAERDRLNAPADLWARLEPHLDSQPRASWWAGLLDVLTGARPQLATAVAAVVILVGGVVTWRVIPPGGEPTTATVATIESAAPEALAEAPVAPEAAGARAASGAEEKAAPAPPQAPPVPAQMADAIAPAAAMAPGGGWQVFADLRVSFQDTAMSPLFAVVRDAEHLLVVYAMTGPESLPGWRLTPVGVWARSGDDERPKEARVNDVAFVGGVTLGTVWAALAGDEACLVTLGFDAVEATNLVTGERRTMGEGREWTVAPLSREEGGPWGFRTLPLRSGLCFTEAGVTLDLDGGLGCAQNLEGDEEEADVGFAGLDEQGGWCCGWCSTGPSRPPWRCWSMRTGLRAPSGLDAGGVGRVEACGMWASDRRYRLCPPQLHRTHAEGCRLVAVGGPCA